MAMKHSEDNGPKPVAQSSLKPALHIQHQLLGHKGLLGTVLTTTFIKFKVQQGRNKQVILVNMINAILSI